MNQPVPLELISLAAYVAEDGIRDVERSRGLGDVYKRQSKHRSGCSQSANGWNTGLPMKELEKVPKAVSYTHLTLPTTTRV